MSFLRGPQDAAALVVQDSRQRILYCGRGNGAFIFSVRALNVFHAALVIRDDKLADLQFQPTIFENFAHDFGITHILLERTSLAQPWDALRDRNIGLNGSAKPQFLAGFFPTEHPGLAPRNSANGFSCQASTCDQ